MVQLGTILYIIAVSRTVIFILSEIYKSFFRREKNLRSIYKKWAIVTGSTDGIGKAYCFELAKRGFNLVLLSRNQQRLSDTQKELLSFNKDIEVRSKAIDFSCFSGDKIEELKSFLEPIKNDIGILLNNVGVSYEHPEYYNDVEQDRRDSIVNVNVVSTKHMIDIVLPIMLEHKIENPGERKGAIINISSIAAIVPSAFLSLYAGTKSFVDHFTQGLHSEYKSKGVDFQSQHPALVATKMVRMRKNGVFVISPEEYAAAGIACFGYGALEIPFWADKIKTFLLSLFPLIVVEKLYFFGAKRMRSVNLKKKARKLQH